jgi:hypothetical protein
MALSYSILHKTINGEDLVVFCTLEPPIWVVCTVECWWAALNGVINRKPLHKRPSAPANCCDVISRPLTETQCRGKINLSAW